MWEGVVTKIQAQIGNASCQRMCLVLLAAIMLFSNAAPAIADRSFDSGLALKVTAILADGQTVVLGQTPTAGAKGITIPPCWVWYVAPAKSFTDKDLPGLLTELRRSSIPGLSLDDTALTHGALEQLKNLPALRWLSLSGCDVSGWDKLSRLKGLESLDLRFCLGVNDGLLKSIKALEKLRNLYLYGYRPDDQDYFRNPPSVDGLSSWRSQHQITDDGMAHLASLVNLRRLSLLGCFQVTEEGIAVLGKLRQIESLDLDSCAGLSGDGCPSWAS